MRQYKEYDNRERRKQMKAKRVRKVFERRNNITRYGIYQEEELERLANKYWNECEFEKCKQIFEQLRNVVATMGYKYEVECLEKVIVCLEGKG